MNLGASHLLTWLKKAVLDLYNPHKNFYFMLQILIDGFPIENLPQFLLLMRQTLFSLQHHLEIYKKQLRKLKEIIFLPNIDYIALDIYP